MGELELYVRIPGSSSVTDTEIYVYYGNAGAAETDDPDTWNADYGVVYHLKEDPAGTAPQARDSTANAVHGNGHIDAFRIAHVQRSDGWIATTWNNMSDPGAFAAPEAEEQEGGDPLPIAGAGVVVCLMG